MPGALAPPALATPAASVPSQNHMFQTSAYRNTTATTGDTYNTKLDFAKKSHKVQVLVGLDCPGEIVPCARERARAR